ncbi:DUF1206 domain-containing protein [Bernardetia sp.]|uniref:DUF1206 domain-containing protein n=1 Tax=Bernardetia sp. TaxID=1937974 RepID=UPI0025BDE375|nr:DUF1206 domain-containing protein [Bernardetia sp.]
MISISSLPTDKKDSLEKFAKSGYFMKGLVYFLIGILATMTAFGLGGDVNGKTGIFQFILEQPFGRILLSIVALGLFGYTAWRWTQAFIAPEKDNDDSAMDKINRIGYFISGFTYGTLASFAMKMAIQGVKNDAGGGRSTVIAQILDMPAGSIIVGILALVIIGKGGYEIWKGFSDKHMKKINTLARKTKEVVREAGKVGYISRGIVLLVIGYLTARAAIENNASKAGGTENAFEFMFSSTSAWLVGLVALGLALYGLFMVIRAKEFRIQA